MIKISVIMPSLNVEPYIKECIESVMNQTLKDIEIICIDAGSTDGTKEIIDKLAEADKRIRVVESEKKSYGYQINKGIELAQGEYIAVVETDDYIAGDMYEKLYYEAKSKNADYVKANYRSYINQENGERFFWNCKLFPKTDLYNKVINPRDNFDLIICDWYIWLGIYKRRFILDNNILLNETKGAAFQDIGFLHQVNVNAERALYLDEYGYNYCIDRESSSTNSGRALNFAYDEYTNLLDRYTAKKTYDGYELYAIFARMAKSFLCCYHDMLVSDLKKNDGIENKYKWFINMIKHGVEKDIISSSNMEKCLWENVSLILSSDGEYQKVINDRGKSLVSHIGQPGENNIVIFCCGNYGFNAYKYLTKKGYEISAFTDNNTEIWGKSLLGVPIKSPKEVLCTKSYVRYVVANEKYYAEIKQQIIDAGINKDFIYIFKMWNERLHDK